MIKILILAVIILAGIFNFWLLYGILTTVLFSLLMPIYAIIRAIQKKYLPGFKEKCGFFKKPELGDKIIMFHGVSVGEIIALENLIKKTKETFPQYKIVITTGTKTGQEIAHKKYDKIADFITYFPYDIPIFVNNFLNKIHPNIILIAETELWPMFTYISNKKSIPLFCINGRMSDSTFRLYKILKPFFKHVLNKYTKILTQSEIDNQKLIAAGSPKEKTSVMKNLKFDIKKVESNIDLGQKDFRVIIAGSTHQGEDEIILEVFKQKLKNYNNIKLLLVPRHTQRIPKIEDILKNLGLNYGFRSKNDNFKDFDVIILDTMGELSKMYSICDFAFIGGSFNKTGGHNPLEATVYNKPVITGPSIHNFRDIYGILSRSSAGKIAKNQNELSDYIEKLLSDTDFYKNACKDCEVVFNDQQGAMDIVIKEINQYLN